MSKESLISIVVPVMNEEESLQLFYKALVSVLEKMPCDHEIIFVDDGSTDSSLSLLKTLAKEDTTIRVFSFRRNLGKAEALSYGFTHHPIVSFPRKLTNACKISLQLRKSENHFMQRKKTIVYVNFAPYDNAGRILDYLTANFSVVLHFSYDHLRLQHGRRSKVTIYENGAVVFHKNLIWLRTARILLFPSLPLVAMMIYIQTFWYIFRFKKKYNIWDIYFSVNAYTAWIGNTLRSFHLVKKTIFWVWDYYPLYFPDWRIRFARAAYAQFDKPAILEANTVIFLNKQLEKVRLQKGIIKNPKKFPVIPIGTNPSRTVPNRKKTPFIIGHVGMLKRGQGLDLLFDTLPMLILENKDLQIEIIGSGPEERYFKKRARKYKHYVKFYGFVQSDNDMDKIIARWHVGLATYVPDPSSEHYWTDPSKIKAYLNQAVPVITTLVPQFAKEIEKNNAGVVIEYNDKQAFANAIKMIRRKNNFYAKNALSLAKKYNFKKLYPALFASV